MLAFRDQENLVHSHQTAAASKALNQGNKQLNPKTPGVKAPKTPFKIPLNDENDAKAFISAKPGLRTGAKNAGIGKMPILADKSVATPGTKARAPLGQKTTNAKARALQTPALDPDGGKLKQNSVSARKPKPRISHAEPVKIDVLADDLEEREIEYMPPRPKDLPDFADDEFDKLDLSVLKDGLGDYMRTYQDMPQADGITPRERETAATKALHEKLDALQEARAERDMGCISAKICMHDVECEDECKDKAEVTARLQAEYEQNVIAIEKEYQKKTEPKWKRHEGPSANASRKAASTLSIPKSRTTNIAAPKPSRLTSTLINRKTTPVNPDPKRHASAVRASNTTMGYSKGRATSASLRQTILPKDAGSGPKLSAASDKVHSEWTKPKSYGIFDEQDTEDLVDDWSRQLEDMMLDGADEDFELALGA